MKRYLIIFVTLLSFTSAYSQGVRAGFNDGIGIELGYSNVYNPVNKCFDEPEHLFTADFTIFGIYFGLGYGQEQIYYDRSCCDTYSENLNTYILRVGPAFRIDGYYSGINISPYIGMLLNSYSEEINDYYYYDYNHTIFEDTYDCNLIYGVKLSFNYQLFSIGGHISNRDVGVSIGLHI